MYDAGRFQYPRQLEAGAARRQAVQQPLPRPQDDWVHPQVDLVDQAGLDRLTATRRTARDADGTVPGDVLCLAVGGLDAVGDEVEGRTAECDRVPRMMGQDEHRT